MRELAKFVMRGPKQAVIVAFLGALIPMMFWMSAAVIAMVTLRQGVQKGLAVFIWSMIPALGWWMGWQDPGALIVMLTALVMAIVLRTSVSWQSTLFSGALTTLVVGLAIPGLAPELIDTLMGMTDQIFRDMAENAQVEYDSEVQEGFRSLMIASFAATLFAFSLGSIFLARAWQAQLFNPGGWQIEFHQMRLSPLFVAGLFLMVMLAPNIGIDVMLVMMIINIPALVCGLALVHGVIGKKKLGGHWLFGFYLSIFMLFPTVLVLLVIVAFIDSLVDFRSRVQAKSL